LGLQASEDEIQRHVHYAYIASAGVRQTVALFSAAAISGALYSCCGSGGSAVVVMVHLQNTVYLLPVVEGLSSFYLFMFQ
jgi:hypothetical protein